MTTPTFILPNFSDNQSSKTAHDNRTKSTNHALSDANGLLTSVPQTARSRTFAARRLTALIIALIFLIAISKSMESDFNRVGLEYVRVSAEAERNLSTNSESNAPIIHRAYWVWDAIDIIEEFINIGNDSDEDAGTDDGDDGGDGGDGGDGDGGDGGGEGDSSHSASAGELTEPIVIEECSEILSALVDVYEADLYFDGNWDGEFSSLEEMNEDDLILMLVELLEYLYDYAELTSSG